MPKTLSDHVNSFFGRRPASPPRCFSPDVEIQMIHRRFLEMQSDANKQALADLGAAYDKRQAAAVKAATDPLNAQIATLTVAATADADDTAALAAAKAAVDAETAALVPPAPSGDPGATGGVQ